MHGTYNLHVFVKVSKNCKNATGADACISLYAQVAHADTHFKPWFRLIIPNMWIPKFVYIYIYH